MHFYCMPRLQRRIHDQRLRLDRMAAVYEKKAIADRAADLRADMEREAEEKRADELDQSRAQGRLSSLRDMRETLKQQVSEHNAAKAAAAAERKKEGERARLVGLLDAEERRVRAEKKAAMVVEMRNSLEQQILADVAAITGADETAVERSLNGPLLASMTRRLSMSDRALLES